jgi:D-alanyl-D-alanine carboxypeptidase
LGYKDNVRRKEKRIVLKKSEPQSCLCDSSAAMVRSCCLQVPHIGLLFGDLMGDFYTDVISVDPRFNSVDRVDDPDLLEPITRQLVEGIISQAQALGFEMMIFETYRSQTRQQQLFLQHATQLQKVGVHHYGLACDIVKVVNGEPSWKGDFSFLGQLAKSAGLIWGGDWGDPSVAHKFIDQPHVQRCSVPRQGDLFAGSWYPDNSYNPYQDDPHLLLARVLQNNPAAARPGSASGRSIAARNSTSARSRTRSVS